MSRVSKLDDAAVRAALASHITLAAAAAKLGVHERTLRRWLAENPRLSEARTTSLKKATRNLAKDRS